MSFINRPYFIVLYKPEKEAMPFRPVGQSWWQPGEATRYHTPTQIRMFSCSRDADYALRTWRKGGLVKSCRLSDLTLEEAQAYAERTTELSMQEALRNWMGREEFESAVRERRITDEGMFDALQIGDIKFMNPVYVASMQGSWPKERRQASKDFEIREVLIYDKAVQRHDD